ncbi:unnamed protein product, partial [Ixodes persulcatus]
LEVLGASAVGADGGRSFPAPDSYGYENPDASPFAVDLGRPAEHGLVHEILGASAIGANGSPLQVDRREVLPWRDFKVHR